MGGKVVPHKITIVIESVLVDGDEVLPAEPATVVRYGRKAWDEFAASGFDDVMRQVDEATRGLVVESVGSNGATDGAVTGNSVGDVV